MNLISPLVPPPVTGSSVPTTMPILSTTEHNNWSIVLFDQTTQSDILKLIPLTPSQKILNQFTNVFNMILTNTSTLNGMRDKCIATPGINQTVITSINDLINNSFLSTSITKLENSLVNYISNYYPASANVDTLLINKFNTLLTKTAPVTFNTTSPTSFTTYMQRTFLNSIIPMLTTDTISNIFTISTNNKYLYKLYIALLNNTFILYNNIYTQLVGKIQQVNITFIASINTNTLLSNKINLNQKSYGACMDLNTCLSNATELYLLIQSLNVNTTTRSINPNTGLPTDPQTGLPTDPQTGLPIDSQTGLPNKAQSGLPNEPQSGLPTKPQSGLAKSTVGTSGQITTTTPTNSNSVVIIVIVIIIIIIIIAVVVLGGKKTAAIL